MQLAGTYDGVIFLGDLMMYREISSVSLENFTRLREATNWMAAIPGNGPLPEVVDFLSTLGVNIHGSSAYLDDIGFFGVGGVTDSVNLILDLRRFFFEERPKPIPLAAKSLETLAYFGIHLQDGAFEVDEWDNSKVKEMEKLRGPFEHTEVEIYNFLEAGYEGIASRNLHILLSHIPPYEEGLNSILPEGVSTGSKAITRFIHTHNVSCALSGHYHIHHEFNINGIPCIVFPAVVDDDYSILSVDSKGKIIINVNKF